TTSTGALSDRHSRAPATSSRPQTGRPPARATAGWMSTAVATATTAKRPLRLRVAIPSSTRAPRTPTCTDPRLPSGAADDHRATPATQPINTPVGRQTARATTPPTTPAGSPAAIPHIITGPAAGTARRLAGSDATGTPPKTGTSTGATPSWAAMVTPRGSA